jgi:hypothetical protein
MFMALLLGSRLPTSLCRLHRKQSFPCIVACIGIYKAAAWQHVDQIHYNILGKEL